MITWKTGNWPVNGTVREQARALVEEFFPRWSEAAKAKLVDGLVEDEQNDPLRFCAEHFGKSAAEGERELVERLIVEGGA